MARIATVAAGVVLFHPNPTQAIDLARALRSEVDHVFLFCNSAVDSDIRAALQPNESFSFIEAEQNLGIGAALNFIALSATLGGYSEVIFFDQDSRPPTGTVSRLLAVQRALLAAGEKPAVVAPLLVADRNGGTGSKAPTYRFRRDIRDHGSTRAAFFVPTSGSLISVDVLRQVGLFRADYFIDGIDVEWSFRAWSHGQSCWVAADCPMPHSVGSGVIAWPLIGFAMPRQKPFRMACTVRNTVYGLRLDHIPLGWKLRQIAYLPLQVTAYTLHHGFDRKILTALAAALVAGLRGRLGPPPGTPDGRARSKVRPRANQSTR